MNYRTHNDDNALDANMTCLQGYVDTSYAHLIQRFGKPLPGSGDGKTDAEWIVKTEEGTLATIYNWKNGPAYNGKYGTPVEKITRWNIGGHSRLAVHAICDILKQQVAEAA